MKRGSIAEPFTVNEVHISTLTHVSGVADPKGGSPKNGDNVLRVWRLAPKGVLPGRAPPHGDASRGKMS